MTQTLGTLEVTRLITSLKNFGRFVKANYHHQSVRQRLSSSSSLSLSLSFISTSDFKKHIQ